MVKDVFTQVGFPLSIFVFVCIVVSSCCLLEADEKGLSWADCVKLTLENNASINSARQAVIQKEAVYRKGRSALLPSLALGSEYALSGTSHADNDVVSVSLSLSQLVYDFSKTMYTIKSASSYINEAEFAYLVASSNIAFELRTAYVGFQRAKKLVELTEEIFLKRKQDYEMIRLKYEAGREHSGSLAYAFADLKKAEYEVHKAQRNLIIAKKDLFSVMGLESDVDFAIKDEWVLPPVEEASDIDAIIEGLPFLKEISARLEGLSFELNSIKSSALPSIFVRMSGTLDGHGLDFSQKRWSVGIGMNWELFDGGSRFYDSERAKAEADAIMAALKGARISAEFVLQKAWNELADAMENLDVKREYLKAGEERAKIADEEYSLGMLSFNEWTIIQNNLISAKKDVLDAEAELILAYASWIQAKGGTLEDEID